jgi:hypothetical protein
MAAAMACRRDAIFCVFIFGRRKILRLYRAAKYCVFILGETQNIASVPGRKILRFYFGRRKILRLYRAAKYCVFILGETQNIASLRAAFEPFI